MSGHGGTPTKATLNFYKVFSGALCLFYVLALLQVQRCSFIKSIDPQAIISNLSCTVYVGVSLFAFVLGFLPMSIGLEYSHKMGRKGLFFHMIFGVYVLGIVAILYLVTN